MKKILLLSLFLSFNAFAQSDDTDHLTEIEDDYYEEALMVETHLAEYEDELKLRFKDEFCELRDFVRSSYEEAWWSPSKKEILAKINVFLEELKSKKITDYTHKELQDLPGKISRISILIKESTLDKFNVIVENVKTLSEEALAFLDSVKPT